MTHVPEVTVPSAAWPLFCSLIVDSLASGPHPQTTPTHLAPHSALVFSG